MDELCKKSEIFEKTMIWVSARRLIALFYSLQNSINKKTEKEEESTVDKTYSDLKCLTAKKRTEECGCGIECGDV